MPLIEKGTFNPRYFSKYFTKHLALACGVVAVSTFNYAFDQQGFNSTQAMTPFDKQFGAWDEESETYVLPTYYLSLLNSLVYVGFAAGAWIGSIISSHYGRRMTFFCMSLWTLVTATILVTSGVSLNKRQLLVARVLNYIYIGMELSNVSVYMSEVVPAPIRGLMVGSYQLSLGIGGLIINGICRGTSTIPNNNSWMIAYWLYYVIPPFVASAIWFIPESSRWLLMHDRHEEALRNLTLLRGEGHEIAAEAELELIRASLLEESDQGSWADIFKGHNCRRTGVVVGVAFFFQATGQVFSGHYGAVFVKSLGTVNPWEITVSQSAINTVTSLIGILLLDLVVRLALVRLFIDEHGRVGCAATYLVLGQPGYRGDDAVFQIYAETPASRLRDNTVRLGATVNIVTIFVVSFTLPYLLDKPGANPQSKVGFIYGGVCFVALIWGYFYLPEL
ncbi:uncharacterized protein LTR77_008973 [Saxophila tyrrhenica]|uniref:Major facilitator superfamily (MFS) profile domain-containing protein n=1 Tax=Saxophila tyrrhenica TaxID=1690608 RepID=A0AAV9NZS8_9PEZI|nr:hypothetical protein LTR77_008973 [Saxophila tyrrhenica]